jgi:hypothetical protein
MIINYLKDVGISVYKVLRYLKIDFFLMECIYVLLLILRINSSYSSTDCSLHRVIYRLFCALIRTLRRLTKSETSSIIFSEATKCVRPTMNQLHIISFFCNPLFFQDHCCHYLRQQNER